MRYNGQMTIINGKIPLNDLTALSVGGFLQANTAYWFEQWRIAAVKAGHNLTITSVADAYRNYAIQERIFRERYTPQKTGGGYYNDVRWWNNTRYVRKQGHAAAAIPGTSNHGRGLAVDLKNVGAEKGAYYQWLAATGPSYGFTNTEGKSVNELWHWVHNGKVIPHTPQPPKPLPNTSNPALPDFSDLENEMFRVRVDSSPNTPSEVGKVFIVQFGPKGHSLFKHIGPEENGIYDLVRVPMYGVSHYQRDLLRSYVIKREADWKVA